LKATARLGLVVDAGALPSIAPGIEVSAIAHHGANALRATGFSLLERERLDDGGAGGRFSLAGGSLSFCRERHYRGAFASFCAVLELGALRGRGIGALQAAPYPSAEADIYYCVPERPRYATGGKCFVLDREPAADETPADVPMTEFGCEQVGMCALGQGCQCDATRCTSAYRETVELELKFNDNELSGFLHGEGVSNEAKVLLPRD
jgi:hypothetical protein